ncbi:hypothetical protein SDJN02_24547, partial [Cucurbita argyrosperma subsp. argyrosperma]
MEKMKITKPKIKKKTQHAYVWYESLHSLINSASVSISMEDTELILLREHDTVRSSTMGTARRERCSLKHTYEDEPIICNAPSPPVTDIIPLCRDS